jgi:spore coat protein CotH
MVLAAPALAVAALALGACGGGGGASHVVDVDAGSDAAADPGPRPAPAVPVYDETLVHQADIVMSPDDWQSIIDDSDGDTWRHATITYDGAVIGDVGVHPSGEASRFPGNQKQSFRVKFDAFTGRGKFAGLKEINIKGEYDDHSMMRERLAFFVFRSVVPTPRAVHTRLTVNGQLRGLYTVREVWDADSIKDHFSEPIGPLYRIRGWVGEDPYLYLGADPGAYTPLPWEQDIGNPARGDDVIGAFLNVVNNQPSMLATVADVDDLLNYLAAFAVTMDTDGFVGDSGVADHFQYFDPQSGKFFILPWDPDNTFSSANEMPNRSITKSFGTSKLAALVRDSASLLNGYKAKIAAVMSAVPLASLQAEVDTIYQQIQPAADEDPFKIFPSADVTWSAGYIKDFAAARYAYLQSQVGNAQ